MVPPLFCCEPWPLPWAGRDRASPRRLGRSPQGSKPPPPQSFQPNFSGTVLLLVFFLPNPQVFFVHFLDFTGFFRTKDLWMARSTVHMFVGPNSFSRGAPSVPNHTATTRFGQDHPQNRHPNDANLSQPAGSSPVTPTKVIRFLVRKKCHVGLMVFFG